MDPELELKILGSEYGILISRYSAMRNLLAACDSDWIEENEMIRREMSRIEARRDVLYRLHGHSMQFYGALASRLDKFNRRAS